MSGETRRRLTEEDDALEAARRRVPGEQQALMDRLRTIGPTHPRQVIRDMARQQAAADIEDEES